ncbi:FAS-associated death domain protein isoform X2 [Hydra vulgaris]|uniref:FAS-associated death domain protein isoform X2 n=1 Tax=Hydra vulgaris TaxID=6087 RepID=A0ABM4DFW2_HYDVU
MDKITYKRKMLEVSKRLTDSDMNHLKYIFTDEIGDAVLEKVSSTIEFIRILEMNNYVGPDNLEGFARILEDLGKTDLVEFITGKPVSKPKPDFRVQTNLNSSSASNNNSLNTELNSKLFDKVSYCIGTDWSRFARYLGLSDSEIDMIDSDNRKTLEKAMQVMVKWKQKNGHVTWQQLKSNLESIERFDIIRQIEKDFASNIAQQDKYPVQEVGGRSKSSSSDLNYCM